ncbi:MAG: hypothetical protein Q9215_007140, partial [Flavoplaca cf. flavocitrina]
GAGRSLPLGLFAAVFCALSSLNHHVVNILIIIFITILYDSLRRVVVLSAFSEPIVLNTYDGGAAEPDNAYGYRPSVLHIPFQILLADKDVL